MSGPDTIMLGCVGDGIRQLGSRGERDTDRFGGSVDLSTPSDSDLVNDLILVKWNICDNVRPSLLFTFLPG